MNSERPTKYKFDGTIIPNLNNFMYACVQNLSFTKN